MSAPENSPKENNYKEPNNAPQQDQEPDGPNFSIGNLLEELRMLLTLLWLNLKNLVLLIINIQDTTDVEGTISSVKAGIRIKGYNIWILVSSSMLACIGLDTNSAAVIIGAMLISPLMSPILGIGLSVGINDRETLLDALYNFLLAVGISLLTAFLYFLITPFGEDTPEILARTKPTLLDVGVAFFGGVAGIVAGSRKDKTNAIPGVAIATALMPPVCVAGFGLAQGEINVFGGAIYLFFLNAVFISVSTFLIVRFLDFPVAKPIGRRFFRQLSLWMVVFVAIVVIPATLIFIDVIKQTNFTSSYKSFVTDYIDSREDTEPTRISYVAKDTLSELRIFYAGPLIPDNILPEWEKILDREYDIKDTRIRLVQTGLDPAFKEEFKSVTTRLAEIQVGFDSKLEEQNATYEKKLADLEKQFKGFSGRDTVSLEEMENEILGWTKGLDRMQIGRMLVGGRTVAKDTGNHQNNYIYTVMLHWSDSLTAPLQTGFEDLITNRLKDRLKQDSIVVIRY